MSEHHDPRQQLPPPPPYDLPPPWVATIDPQSGRMYYANASTGESSWDPPIPPPIPPLPPPPPPPPPAAAAAAAALPPATGMMRWTTSDVTRPEQGEQHPQFPHESTSSIRQKDDDAELRHVTAGQLADACWIQSNNNNNPSNDGYYKPIPWDTIDFMARGHCRPAQEESRIHTRLFALYDKLKNLSSSIPK